MQSDFCRKCAHFKTCKTPCRPVEIYLDYQNHVFEKTVKFKNGSIVQVVFSNHKVFPESVLAQEYDKDGKPDNKRAQKAFSTENAPAFLGSDTKAKTTGILRDRLFLGFSYQDLSVKYSVSVETARKTYHHAEKRIYKLLQDLDTGKRDLSYWENLTNKKTKGMRQDIKIYLMHYVFNLRPAEIQKFLNINSLSYVSRQIKKVAGQIKTGKINLIETTPQKSAAAKSRRERRAKKK